MQMTAIVWPAAFVATEGKVALSDPDDENLVVRPNELMTVVGVPFFVPTVPFNRFVNVPPSDATPENKIEDAKVWLALTPGFEPGNASGLRGGLNTPSRFKIALISYRSDT